MRLVSEDDVLALLTNHHFDNDKGNFDLLIHNLCKEVRRIPTAYDVDRVVEQLEEEKKRAFELCLATNDSAQRLKYIEKEQTIVLAIEVVKGGGVDVN